MIIPLYQVDAFTDKPFGGNPAAVCPLEAWLPDPLLRQIAGENNLSETAFFVAGGEGWHVRWFTPAVEMELCGHATLASAHILYRHLGFAGDRIRFSSLGGPLGVERNGDRLVLDFPS
jgi:PhzF family phenazine biosynthesis protein